MRCVWSVRYRHLSLRIVDAAVKLPAHRAGLAGAPPVNGGVGIVCARAYFLMVIVMTPSPL
jgi:hypothetical protein